jgi:endonuclease/exonuclease/phosphatase family metal-dependent hydrolase
MMVTSIVRDSFAISGQVHSRDGNIWWISVVYGPQSNKEKAQFLAELSERRSLCPGAWLVIGDFNIILQKNNENLDRRSMTRFRDFVNSHELKELYMQGRMYTWSNERQTPTLTRIDRALISID